MKKLLLGLFVILFAFGSAFAQTSPGAQLPFSRGVNFLGAFDAYSVGQINPGLYNEQDFTAVKNMGVNVIRLPINFQHFTNGRPNYTVDPVIFRYLDTYVDLAERNQIYIIIDYHPYDIQSNGIGNVAKASRQNIDIAKKIWPQIAEHYKNRSQYVLYELFNEPNDISARDWTRAQQEILTLVRRVDPNRKIIVGGADYNAISTLLAMTPYRDNNLIYNFHFYDPYLFTHQGAGWPIPSLENLSGVPFPYDSARMPPMPASFRGTWLEQFYINYPREGSAEGFTKMFDDLAAWSARHNVPLFSGEFGVYIGTSADNERVNWYRIAAEVMTQRGIAWTMWDYFGPFGLFTVPLSSMDLTIGLNVNLARAIGFTPPAQQQVQPRRAGFTIYDDLFNRAYINSFPSATTVDFRDTNVADGECAIRWANIKPYAGIQIDLLGTYDLSALAQQGYVLEFKAKTNAAVRFQVYFQNPESANSIPWRRVYEINERNLTPDGTWKTIRVPLRDMQDAGAYINATSQWIDGRGEFDWKRVTIFSILAMETDMSNRTIYIDSIRVVAP
jgi:endoglucanase